MEKEHHAPCLPKSVQIPENSIDSLVLWSYCLVLLLRETQTKQQVWSWEQLWLQNDLTPGVNQRRLKWSEKRSPGVNYLKHDFSLTHFFPLSVESGADY